MNFDSDNNAVKNPKNINCPCTEKSDDKNSENDHGQTPDGS
jgi:hypothetical protein